MKNLITNFETLDQFCELASKFPFALPVGSSYDSPSMRTPEEIKESIRRFVDHHFVDRKFFYNSGIPFLFATKYKNLTIKLIMKHITEDFKTFHDKYLTLVPNGGGRMVYGLKKPTEFETCREKNESEYQSNYAMSFFRDFDERIPKDIKTEYYEFIRED